MSGAKVIYETGDIEDPYIIELNELATTTRRLDDVKVEAKESIVEVDLGISGDEYITITNGILIDKQSKVLIQLISSTLSLI